MRRLALVVVLVAGCDGGGGPTLEDVAPQTVRVNEELRLSIAIDNPTGTAVSLRVQDPMLPAFESVSRISTEPGGAIFRWSPLSSHVGSHELVFELTDGGSHVYDSKTAVIEVLPSEDAAPVFVHPGPGGTYDLERDPCVRVDVEVRDDDSADVAIDSRAALPERASLSAAGPKRASFDWCPTPDQVASSERWTIQLVANDGDHPAVEHDYVVVLRTGNKEGCPGASPAITVTSPAMGEALRSGTTYPIEVTVSDDMGLRDPPLLYYSTTEPADLAMPDVTQFDQVEFQDDDGGAFVARIPNLGLAEGAMQEVWFLVSATDNDDPNGSSCDHRTDSALTSFFAVGGPPADGSLPACDFCSNSTECESGICAATAAGGRCVDSCSGGGACASGTCGATVTREGATRAGCGPTSEVCMGGGGGGPCTNDGFEPNDSTSASFPYTAGLSGQICENDDDYFSISVARGSRVTAVLDNFVSLDGDLDLSLRRSDGTILDTSAGVSNSETVEYCNGGTTETLYARVTGYLRAQNSYDLTMTVAPDAAMCCMDDTNEPDDTRMTARSITFGAPVSGTATASFDGTVCAGDSDWIAIPMMGPGRIEVDLVFVDADGDIDIRLLNPSGAQIASSLSSTDDESLGVDVPGGGTYALEVSLFGAGGNDYLGEVRRITGMGCTTTRDCPLDTVCNAGSCVSDVCTGSSACPSGHLCQSGGPVPAANRCGQTCTVNSDCRSGEACKWNVEGRACGRSGSGQNGDSCPALSSCGGQRACVNYTGGYCARVGCTSGADCENGTPATHCVNIRGQNVCALHCVGFPSPCRESEGYTCELLPSINDRDGTPNRFVCVPP
ncbi:MAG: PPC domain-containing protein [Sandaracinaceae bacterium]